MKRLIPMFAIVFATMACAQEADVTADADGQAGAAASFTAEDEAAIRDMLEGYAVSLNEADWASQAAYYTEDAVRMPPNEPVYQGRDAIIAASEALPPVTSFTLTPQEIEGEGDLAWAHGTFTLDLAPPDADPVAMEGKWQAVYERQEDGTWLCVSDIWNTDAPTGT
jgi:ketosteroid isomerase-like protein